MSPHILKRMVDRSFNETELRRMLEDARGVKPAQDEGRWIAESNHDGRDWEIILEPLTNERLLLVIPAYPVE